MADRVGTELVVDALTMAAGVRDGTADGTIFAWINTYDHRRLYPILGDIPLVEWGNENPQPEADLAAWST